MDILDPGELRRLAEKAGSRLSPMVLAGLLLVPLLAGTVAGSAHLSQSVDAREDRLYQDHVDFVSDQMEDVLVSDISNLYGLKGFIDGTQSPLDLSAFHAWVQGSGWQERAPGFLAAGVASRVDPEDAEEHLSSLRTDPELQALGYPDLKDQPAIQETGFVLDRRWPPQGPGPGFGADLTAGPDARSILQTAIDHGRAAILGEVNLAEDQLSSDDHVLYLLVLPVYSELNPEGTEERRKTVEGLVVSIHDLQAGLAPVLSSITASGREVEIQLYEILEQEEGTGPADAARTPPAGLAERPGFDPIGYAPISVGTSTWPLYVHRPANLLSEAEQAAPVLALAGGTALSVALAALTYLLAAGRQRARRMAKAMTHEARAANTSLARAHADLERFTYTAAHHMQEPVRMVSLYTRLLQRQYTDELDEAANEYIEFAADGAVRIHELLNDLLEYASLQQGIESEPTDLDDVVEGALARVDADVDHPQARVEVDPLPTVRGDPALLSQVFYHLIGNAFKFTPEGESPRIEILATERDDAWEITVTDNGVGIDPRHHARLFNLFERVENPRDREGTGAGLAICRRILELHGGRIWIDESYEDGARFHILLPKAETIEGARAPPAIAVEADEGERELSGWDERTR